jgi:hypothetical protein
MARNKKLEMAVKVHQLEVDLDNIYQPYITDEQEFGLRVICVQYQ